MPLATGAYAFAVSAKPLGRCWTVKELECELSRFEQELRRAELRESSVATYVG